MTRRLLYVPNLPLPLIFSEADARREGYYIDRWQGGLELKSHLGDVIELVDPHKRKRDPYGWEMPEPFPTSSTRWLQVEPINDPGVQMQLKLEHERELAEAAAREAAFNSPWEEDENWDDDGDAWGWSPPTPGPGDTPISPSYSPQPSPEPE